jgi:hypothetical protein
MVGWVQDQNQFMEAAKEEFAQVAMAGSQLMRKRIQTMWS